MATTFQWQQGDSAGANFADIPGATSATYTIPSGDTGHTYRVVADGVASTAYFPTPSSGTVYLNGDFSTGDFSQWAPGNLDDIGSAVIVPGKMGGFPYMMKAVCPANHPAVDASMVERGDTLAAYQLPWLVVGGEAWHRMLLLFPSGNDPNFPGKYTVYPSGGWSVIMEWHNRTDQPAVGSWSGYVSNYVGVHRNTDGTGKLLFRAAGGVNQVAHNTEYYHPNNLVYDHPYDILVHMHYAEVAGVYSPMYEWIVDGTTIVSSSATPNAYKLADGSSGQRFQVGLYRGVAPIPWTDTIYIAGVKVGATRASVGG